MTDSDIVKALECCISDKDDVCLECPLQNDCFANADGNSEVKELALDLINRLQADVDNYKQIAENQQSVSMERGFEIKRLKADIERLENAYKQCAWERDIFAEDMKEEIKKDCSYLMLDIKTIKAEAYKEFAEKVKLLNRDNLIIWNEQIDNILEKLVGEDNG